MLIVIVEFSPTGKVCFESADFLEVLIPTMITYDQIQCIGKWKIPIKNGRKIPKGQVAFWLLIVLPMTKILPSVPTTSS